ncbi:amino acid adenylation domain-containing protein [Flavobacteriaceae bacterium M23B6Z8]
MEDFIQKLDKIDLFLIEKNGELVLKRYKNRAADHEENFARHKDEIISFIKSNKQELIAFLQQKEATKSNALYNLSPLQEGLLFHALLDKESAAYIEQLYVDFPSGVDVTALKTAWESVIANHTIFRTGFFYEELKVPVQYVNDRVVLPFKEIDYSDLEVSERESKIQEFLKKDMETPFDFGTAPLMRITLIRMSSSAYRMVFTNHHILLDGWSLSIVMEEFMEAYEGYVSKTSSDSRREDHYEDYIKYISSKNNFTEEEFWRNYMVGIEAPTSLPFKKKVDLENGYGEAKGISFKMATSFTDSLINLTKEHRITLNTMLQGVWAVLLSRYTQQSNILFGVTVSGRPIDLERSEQRVGLYINTLPLHAAINDDEVFTSWLQKLQNSQSECREHQYSSLAKIQRLSKIEGDLFDSILVFENFPISKVLSESEGTLEVGNVHTSRDQSNYPLSIIVHPQSELSVEFRYNDAFLSEESVLMISKHFKTLLRNAVENPHLKICDLGIVTEAEAKKLLVDFNATSVDFLAADSVVTQFESQVKETPSHAAVVTSESTLTYEALDAYTNQLARYLQDKGLAHGDLAGVKLGRGTGLVSSVLGVLKTGAGYVAIDPEYPSARIDYMESDSGCKWVIDADFLEDFEKVRASYAATSLATPIKTGDLAYVIYTSGSTGTPKGVKISHGNLLNLCNWHKDLYKLSPSSRGTLFSGTGFDASVWEIYPYLLSGASLYPLPNTEERYDLSFLSNFLEDHQITHAYLPSQVCQDLVNEELSIAGLTILTGGDALHLSKPSRVKIYNNYGPTENTVVTTYYEVQDGEAGMIPIGYPISNTQVYVLSDGLQLQPVGVVGELCISGASLSSGYLNQEVLTEEKFVANPFVEGEKIYRTGDLARWRADGSLIFCGRKDSQVKIRGYRIELGEIEYAIQDQDGIQQAAVLAKEDAQGQKRLVGYVVSSVDFEKTAIEASLEKTLPTYMIPKQWVVLESLPLNQNGKVDKKALPEADGSERLKTQYVAPRDENERKLIAVWEDLLGVDNIGVHNTFFELGGHSLLATRLASAIRKEMNVEVAIADIFSNPTVAKLSEFMNTREKGLQLPAITPQDKKDAIPLSFGQERLWFIDKLQGSVEYHIPIVLSLSGVLDPSIMEACLQGVLSRHEVLRTVIYAKNGKRYQKINEAYDWSLEVIKDVSEDSLKDVIRSFISEPFDLSSDYMFKAKLFEIETNEFVFAGVFHHIASDGWSQDILINDFVKLYSAFTSGEAFALPELTIQYSDYAIWQRKHLTEQALEEPLSYWKDKLLDVQPVQLPTDFSRPAVVSTKGATLKLELDDELARSLQELVSSQGVTMFMLLLSVFKVLLYRYSDHDDICVGTTVANRTQKEIEGLIGYFVNTLALRNTVKGNASFSGLLQQIKESTLEAYDHQQVPFEKIVDKVVTSRNMSMHPIFQTMFVLQNNPDTTDELQMNNLELKPYPLEHKVSQFDLTLTGTELNEGILLEMEYCTDLFKESTIERMLNHYKELLISITKNPEAKIGELSMLSAKETEELSRGFQFCEASFPVEHTVVDLFRKQVEKTPEAAAIFYDGEVISYSRLNKSSNQLANKLAKRKGAETAIALSFNRSIDAVIAILGILKAGAACVPIDPSFPLNRKNSILKESNCKVIVGDHNTLEGIEDKIEKISIEALQEEDSFFEDQSTAISNAYIIYSSGTTGKPKGIQIRHESFTNLLFDYNERYHMNAATRILQLTNLAVDIAFQEIFSSLINGATLYIPHDEIVYNAEAFRQFVTDHQINFIQVVPDTLRSYFLEGERLESVTHLLCGGDKLDMRLKDKILQKGYPLYNIYGQTETTIDTLISKCEIGTEGFHETVSNYQVYILNEHLQLQPIGIPGEICTAGIGVSSGYLGNEPDLKEKFTKNPFGSGTLYRTGDVALRTSDGSIQFVGRKDNQVKIRGFRVELGAIEQVINELDEIQDSLVVSYEDANQHKFLVAYVVTEKELNKVLLEAHLASKLPDYMIPRTWMKLDNFEYSNTGKIDRNVLPVPEITSKSHERYIAPESKLEKQLAVIWMEVLGVERVGLNDNFFELGGHSLLVITLLSRMNKEIVKRHILKMDYEIQLVDLFRFPTISGLIDNILDKAKPSGEKTVHKLNKTIHDTPIFCIPPAGGDIHDYIQFAKLMETHYGVYAFRSPGLDGITEPLTSVPKIASLFIREMQKIQPQGPYMLAAYSFGGDVMMEMAIQLEAKEQKVSKMIAIDCYLKSGKNDADLIKERPSDLDLIMEVLEMMTGDALSKNDHAEIRASLTGMSRAQLIDFITERAASSGLEMNTDQIKGMVNVYMANSSMFYIPELSEPLDTEVILFKTNEAETESVLDQEQLKFYGWQSITNLEVKVVKVPGTHTTVLKVPNVQHLSDKLLETLQNRIEKAEV